MPAEALHRHDLRSTLDNVDFRWPTEHDIDGMLSLYWMFFTVSDLPDLGLSFDPQRMWTWVEKSVVTGKPAHIVAVDKGFHGQVIGLLDYVIDHRGTVEPWAFLDNFYVHRDWRMSGVARTLLTLALDAAQADGAVAFRAGISSGIGHGKNLFLKAGFRETAGSTLLARRL